MDAIGYVSMSAFDLAQRVAEFNPEVCHGDEVGELVVPEPLFRALAERHLLGEFLLPVVPG